MNASFAPIWIGGAYVVGDGYSATYAYVSFDLQNWFDTTDPVLNGTTFVAASKTVSGNTLYFRGQSSNTIYSVAPYSYDTSSQFIVSTNLSATIGLAGQGGSGTFKTVIKT